MRVMLPPVPSWSSNFMVSGIPWNFIVNAFRPPSPTSWLLSMNCWVVCSQCCAGDRILSGSVSTWSRTTIRLSIFKRNQNYPAGKHVGWIPSRSSTLSFITIPENSTSPSMPSPEDRPLQILLLLLVMMPLGTPRCFVMMLPPLHVTAPFLHLRSSPRCSDLVCSQLPMALLMP